MCRLLGYATAAPASVVDVVGEAELPAFVELSRTHGDGWGVAWAMEDGVEVHKCHDAAVTSLEFAAHAAETPSDAGLVHLRWATMGLEVKLENAHPFTDGYVAFAHNGSIYPPVSIDPLIDPEVAGLRRGDTDSERYFLVVLSRLRRGMSPEEALADAVADIARTCRFSCLNCVLLTPEALYAVNHYDPRTLDHPEEYYHLSYRVSPDAVVVASSGWPQDGWTPMANGEMLAVRRHTLEMVTTRITTMAA